jgi:tetratricopeptide (TPR) repeat protein
VVRNVLVTAIVLIALTAGLPVAAQPGPARGPTGASYDRQAYDLSMTKGLVRYADGKYEEALGLFRQALTAKPGDLRATEYLARTLLGTQQPAAAEPLFRQILAADPSAGKAWLGLAISQYRQGKYQEAKESLAAAERHLPRNPQVSYYQGLVREREPGPGPAAEAQFNQGVAYYEQGAMAQAQAAFQSVADSSPNSRLAGSARDYLARISGKAPRPSKRWDLTFAVSPQFDSNVVLAPLGTQPIGGSTGISRKDDYVTVLYGRGEFRLLQTDSWTAGLGYGLYQSFHRTLSGFDVEDHTPTAFLEYRIGPVQTRLQYVFDYVNVGRSPYLISNAFLPIVTVTERRDAFTELRFGYQNKDFQHARFPTNSVRDGKNWMVGLTQYQLFAADEGFVRVGYTFDSDRTGGGSPAFATPGVTTNADWAYNAHRFSAGVGLPPVMTLRLNLDFDYYRQDYDNPNSFSATGTTARHDNIYQVTGTIGRPLTENFTISGQYTYLRDDANIDVFNYSRSIAALILTGRF